MADTAEQVMSVTGRWLPRGKAFSRIVLAALGLLLLATALLKTQGPADGALGQNTILLSPRLQFAIIEAEALLGLWLLSGWAKRAAWFFAVAFFLVVAGTSLYLGLRGHSSCGCFGRIHVSPWNAFALDVTCLVTLGFCWPSLNMQRDRSVVSRWIRDALVIAVGAGAILTLCLGGVLFAGGSHTGGFLARLRGEQISVEPPMTDIGSGVAGQVSRFTVLLHNHTDRSITVTGGTASCACIAIDDLPVTIPPDSSVAVTVVGRFKGTPGPFQQEYRFYTDGNEQDRVVARFKGWIIESSSQ